MENEHNGWDPSYTPKVLLGYCSHGVALKSQLNSVEFQGFILDSLCSRRRLDLLIFRGCFYELYSLLSCQNIGEGGGLWLRSSSLKYFSLPLTLFHLPCFLYSLLPGLLVACNHITLLTYFQAQCQALTEVINNVILFPGPLESC